jgi:hypothetical protein
MTTLVDVIFVDFLDAGSIPATSTNLRKAPVGTQVCQPEPLFLRRLSAGVAGACGGVLRRRTLAGTSFGFIMKEDFSWLQLQSGAEPLF